MGSHYQWDSPILMALIQFESEKGEEAQALPRLSVLRGWREARKLETDHR